MFTGRIAPLVLLVLAAAGMLPARAASPPPGAEVSLPDIVAPLLGAVVNVSVLDGPSAQTPAGTETPKHSLGSGFIIDPAGYIVTNRHVVANGISVTVTLSDDRQFAARVLASNRWPDLALLKIDAGAKLPSVRFGNSNALRLGETVFAIGNPLGLSGSISVGVVSALNRNVKSTVIDDYIQTDAAINHGNSGGPLFNLRGEVVGVNWALIAPEDAAGSVGLGLAIPSNDAATVVDDMRRFGRLRAGFPGMSLQGVTPALAAALGLPGTQGGVVTQVLPNGPAAKAGIEVGDVVLQIGTQKTADVRALLRQVAYFPPGSSGTLLLWRAGRTISVDLTFSEFPPQYDPAGPPLPITEAATHPRPPALGLRLSGGPRGVLVELVSPGSLGAEAGLARGDIIERVSGAKVATPDEVTAAFARARADGHPAVAILVAGDKAEEWRVISVEGH